MLCFYSFYLLLLINYLCYVVICVQEYSSEIESGHALAIQYCNSLAGSEWKLDTTDHGGEIQSGMVRCLKDGISWGSNCNDCATYQGRRSIQNQWHAKMFFLVPFARLALRARRLTVFKILGMNLKKLFSSFFSFPALQANFLIL